MNIKHKMLGTSALTGFAVAAMSLAPQSSVKADSSNFEGAFASVGATATSTDTTLNNSANNIPAADGDASSAVIEAAFVGFETSATTILGRAASKLSNSDDYISGEATLGYNFAINDKFLLGLDITANSGGYDVTKNSDYSLSTVAAPGAGDASAASGSIAVTTGTQTTKYEEDETYSIGIRPSVAVNDQTMVYSRLSYGQTKATLKTTYSGATENSVASKTVSDDLESYGLGLGAVYNFKEKAFLDVSLNYRKTESLVNKIDDSGQTATLASHDLTSATDHLQTTAEDNESYQLAIKVGTRF